MGLIDTDVLMTDVRNTITEKSGALDWINLINRQPTAYNVNNVVEQLEAMKEKNPFISNKKDKSIEASTSRQILDYAIEIVKGESERNKHGSGN